MSDKNRFPEPLSRDNIDRALKARPALSDNLAQIAKSIFVSAGEDAPKVNTRVIPIERIVDGQKSLHYEIQIEVDGVRLGERATPPPMRGYRVHTSRSTLL